MMKSNVLLLKFLLATICFLVKQNVWADEFHVWFDGDGRKHISSIPRYGFTQDGDLRRAYNPNSLVAQHHAMREALSEQSAQIAKRQAELARLENPPLDNSHQERVRAPKEGIMGLRDLIKLERRGGRYSEKE